ncbi:MAG TPA: cupin domain-containing protein [Byssovorax sp.]|jgi:uncharacterized cupin superfamily protein
MSTDKRSANVVNLESVEPHTFGKGKLGARTRRLGAASGGRALGCTHHELEPGKTSYPFHFHSAFEEAMYVLEGEGTLRLGDQRIELRPGDYVSMPAGPSYAHTVANTGERRLVYLCMSGPATPATLDVVAYPDSNKVSFASGVEPGKVAWRDDAWTIGVVKQEDTKADYFEGEPLAKE